MTTTRLRRSRRSLVAALVVALLLVGDGLCAEDQGGGDAQDWRMSGLGDGGRYRPAGSSFWRIAQSSGTIPAGSEVVMAGGGGILRLDAGAITAQSEARVQVPTADEGKLFRQFDGRVRYHVEKSSGDRFDVLTPYLSLLVRGTVFEVQVDQTGTLVEVDEGIVKVWTNDGATSVRLHAGQSAQVLASNLGTIKVKESAGANFNTAGIGRHDSDNDNSQPVDRGLFDRDNDGSTSAGRGSGGNGGGGGGSAAAGGNTGTGGSGSGSSGSGSNSSTGGGDSSGGSDDSGSGSGDDSSGSGSGSDSGGSDSGNDGSDSDSDGGLGGAVGGAVGGAADSVSDAVGGVSSSVGGALGGSKK